MMNMYGALHMNNNANPQFNMMNP